MKYNVKKLAILLMFFIIIYALSIEVHADSAIDFSKADSFITTGKTESGGINLDETATAFTEIGNILKYIGAGILIGATAYMGILYMISPPERQAKLKTQLIGLVVSSFVIFGGYYIWKVIVELMEGIMG